jgi:hypothetical protein
MSEAIGQTSAPALTGPKTLEQRVRVRVQESINSVLEDEELNKLVDDELVKLLKGHTIPARDSWTKPVEHPPVLPLWVKSEAEAQMKARLAARITELLNAPEFQINRSYDGSSSNPLIEFGPELEKAFRAIAPLLVQNMFGELIAFSIQQMKNALMNQNSGRGY